MQTAGVRSWKGDFVELPNYMGPFDVLIFNAVFGNFYSQREVMLKAISMLSPKSFSLYRINANSWV